MQKMTWLFDCCNSSNLFNQEKSSEKNFDDLFSMPIPTVIQNKDQQIIDEIFENPKNPTIDIFNEPVNKEVKKDNDLTLKTLPIQMGELNNQEELNEDFKKDLKKELRSVKKERKINQDLSKEKTNEIQENINEIEEENLKENLMGKIPNIQLEEISGNLFNNKTLQINSEGLINKSMRNKKDGIVNFGYNDNKINDYALNLPDNIENSGMTAFKILFNKDDKQYYIGTDNPGIFSDLIIFIKIDKGLKIDKKIIVSLGEAHFTVEIIDIQKNTLQIDLTTEKEGTKRFIFQKDKKKISIGRGRKCDVLLHQLSYSRIQTSFVFDEVENAWLLYDGDEGKGSTNGTWVFLNWMFPIYENLKVRIGQSLIQFNFLNE